MRQKKQPSCVQWKNAIIEKIIGYYHSHNQDFILNRKGILISWYRMHQPSTHATKVVSSSSGKERQNKNIQLGENGLQITTIPGWEETGFLGVTTLRVRMTMPTNS